MIHLSMRNNTLSMISSVKVKMWMAGFQVFTGNLMRSLVDIDSSLLEKLYNSFEDNGIMITAKNQNRVALVMFYVKLKSAMQDLEEIEDRTQIFPAPILYKFTSDVLTQMDKQYPDIKNMTDEGGMSINKLIEHYNDAGKKYCIMEKFLETVFIMLISIIYRD